MPCECFFTGNIASAIKYFDVFESGFQFRYKGEDSYQTLCGGIVMILFALGAVAFGIYNFVGFVQRDMLTINRVETSLTHPYDISFYNYSSNFAVKLDCGDAAKYFDVKLTYIPKLLQDKRKEAMKTHACTKEDFNGILDDVDFENNGLGNAICPNRNESHYMTGIYVDRLFYYYEIVVQANKDKLAADGKDAADLLQANECKFNIYYLETVIEFFNYKNPEKQVLRTEYVKLKADEYITSDLYFIVQKFESFQNWLFDTATPKYSLVGGDWETIGWSLGYDRLKGGPAKPDDSAKFIKLCLRSALTSIGIQRQYPKITEFFADVASLFSDAFVILFFIMTARSRFYADRDLIADIFNLKLKEEGENGKLLIKLKEEIAKRTAAEPINESSEREESIPDIEVQNISGNSPNSPDSGKDQNHEFSSNRHLRANQNISAPEAKEEKEEKPKIKKIKKLKKSSVLSLKKEIPEEEEEEGEEEEDEKEENITTSNNENLSSVDKMSSENKAVVKRTKVKMPSSLKKKKSSNPPKKSKNKKMKIVSPNDINNNNSKVSSVKNLEAMDNAHMDNQKSIEVNSITPLTQQNTLVTYSDPSKKASKATELKTQQNSNFPSMNNELPVQEVENVSNSSPDQKEEEKELLPNFEFNTFEMVILLLINRRCLCGTIRKKAYFLEECMERLSFQMDVLTYLKRMQRLEILNYIFLDQHHSSIIKMISKPSLGVEGQSSKFYSELNEQYINDLDEKDITNFCDAVDNLYTKQNKQPFEEKLLDLATLEITSIMD
ncbi:MAG: hypothetical protein MJ252_13800 [archaeon]|nr:hypothetical protein [archaeon]